MFRFPPGVFEIGVQMLVPPHTEIVGAASPNTPGDPTASPDWAQQTVFLATRGQTRYGAQFCAADDMVLLKSSLFSDV